MPFPNLSRSLVCIAALMLSLALLSGCGDGLPNPEKIDTAEEYVEALHTFREKFAKTMENIKDMDSFESNKDDITALFTFMLDMQKRLDELKDELDKEKMSELMKKYQESSKEFNERGKAVRERLKDDKELSKAISEHIAEVVKNHPYTKEKDQARKDRMEQSRKQREAEREERSREMRERFDNRPRSRKPEDVIKAFHQRAGGADKVLTIIIKDIPADADHRALSRSVFDLAKTAASSVPYKTSDTQRTILVGGAKDPQTFADSIDFAEVLSVDTDRRTITVRYKP